MKFDMNNNGFSHTIIGKIIGSIIGAIALGPIGLVIGFLLGHFYDTRMHSTMPRQRSQQEAFLHNLFALLGFVAKMDGQVSEAEIECARQVMRRLHLTATQKEQAIRAFSQGKHEHFDWVNAAQTIKQLSGAHHQRWAYIVMNSQVQMAYADGMIKEVLKPVLQRIATILGLPLLNFNYYDAIFGWQTFYHRAWQQYQEQASGAYSSSSSSYDQHYAPSRKASMSLSQAYQLLGVSEQTTEAEIKKAYRKLMSKYHPDKLMSKGLSESEMQAATEKVQRFQAAYEVIRTAKRF